jgi:agmatine deiminase
MKIKQSPASLGYRMPPEWAKHEATWLAFPHHRTDFPYKRAVILHVFAEMARVITEKERLRFLVKDNSERDQSAQVFERAGVALSQVDFVVQNTNRSWLRDSLPLWVTKRGAPKLAVNFRFSGWARYRDHKLDDAAGLHVAQKFSKDWYEPSGERGERLVLEGGSIDVDEYGTLLTTNECLLSSARARFAGLSVQAVERHLEQSLGIKKVLWADTGIIGDDTSGHIDDFVRFAPGGRVLVCSESRKSDQNYLPLLAARKALGGATNAKGTPIELVALPMPQAVTYGGERLPASYANFYVCNAAVLVPTFNDPNDRLALSVIADCFPDRATIGIYARDLVVGLGTLHCSSMQEPA